MMRLNKKFNDVLNHKPKRVLSQKHIPAIILSSIFLWACTSPTQPTVAAETSASSSQKIQQGFKTEKIATFNEPWALTNLPDGRLLVTERAGKLLVFDPVSKEKLNVLGVPKVAYGGQGGLGDIILHPQFASNHWIYLSYAEQGQGGYGAKVIRAKLDFSNAKQPRLLEEKVIWQQVPKVSGQGHYGHRMLFGNDGKLWIASGERQHFDPAQDMQSNLGKILRLNEDGTPAEGNPFAAKGGVTAQIWSLGHRNPLGIAMDQDQQLWVVEMGPEGGDELNLISKGTNYGYPLVSEGNHYGGKPIPNHDTRPEFQAPDISWTPVISPSSLIIYSGKQFPQWQNKALIGGLSSKAIVVVDLATKPVQEVQRIDMGERIRGLLQAPDGGIWVIEDGKNGQLLKLTAN